SAHRGLSALSLNLPADLSAVVAPAGSTASGSLVLLLVQIGVLGLLTWRVLQLRTRPGGWPAQYTLAALLRGR
ncbi:MAG: hypothetical protein ACRCZF_03310, partial [Gemmataceae bacterium]